MTALREDVAYVAHRGARGVASLLQRLAFSDPEEEIGVEPGEIIRPSPGDACVITRVGGFIAALTTREARILARGCAEAMETDPAVARAMTLDRLQEALFTVAEQLDP